MRNKLFIFRIKLLEQIKLQLGVRRRQQSLAAYGPNDIAFVVCRIMGGVGPARLSFVSQMFVIQLMHRSGGPPW
jgi:hypothetical protein